MLRLAQQLPTVRLTLLLVVLAIPAASGCGMMQQDRSRLAEAWGDTKSLLHPTNPAGSRRAQEISSSLAAPPAASVAPDAP